MVSDISFQERSENVRADASVEVCGINVRQRRREGTIRRIIECSVKAAERAHDLMDELLDGRGISHVAGHSQSSPAGRTNTFRNRVQSLLVACSEYHGGARLCKRTCSHLSNAPACTGNKSDLTGEQWLNGVSSHNISPLLGRQVPESVLLASAHDLGKSNPVAIIQIRPTKRTTGSR